MNKRNIELSGHIIDSLTLTKTMGIIFILLEMLNYYYVRA